MTEEIENSIVANSAVNGPSSFTDGTDSSDHSIAATSHKTKYLYMFTSRNMDKCETNSLEVMKKALKGFEVFHFVKSQVFLSRLYLVCLSANKLLIMYAH